MLSGFGYFWPIWPIIGLGTILGLHAVIAFSGLWNRAEHARLTHRVEELTRTRAGAVHAEAEELRRIERDLHDGAQARLVALSMTLGLAEDKLDREPGEARELLEEARGEARRAITELRNLARGIAPPILDRPRARGRARVARVERPDAARDDRGRRRAAHAGGDRDRRLLRRHRGDGQRRQARRRHEGTIRLDRRPDMLVIDISDDGRGGADPAGSGLLGLRRPRRGARRHADHRQPARRRDAHPRGAPMRAVIAEDLALLREGLERLLGAHDIEVVRAGRDGPALVEAVVELRPDVAVVDVRMPPSSPTRACARRSRRARRSALGVLVLSQYVEPGYAAELLADGHGGVGYLLKERVGDTREFVDAVRRVAGGGAALDPEVVAQFVGAGAPRAAPAAHRARARGARADGRGPLERRDRGGMVVTPGRSRST